MKILFVILVIGVLVTSGVLINGSSAQSAMADNLTLQIESNGKALARISNQTQKTNADIAVANQDIAGIDKAVNLEKEVIPGEIDSTDVLRNLLTLGQEFELVVIPLTMQEWAKVKVVEHEYSIMRISLKVSGAQEQLLNYIATICPLYPTLLVESLSVVKQGNDNVSADLLLALYAR